MKHIDKLNKLGACNEAVEWAKEMKNGQAAWDNCERGDWMLWLAGKTAGKPKSVKRKKLVLCACECARLALKYVPKGEDRPLKCIETAEAWARGEASYDDLVEARRATAAYAYASAYASAASFASSASFASYASYAASYAAYEAASYAAYAAYEAASYAAYEAADDAYVTKTLKECADIVRKHYPKVPMVKL